MLKYKTQGACMRFFLVLLFFYALAFAKITYSQMSNEELIALIGYVEQSKEFELELKSRLPTFTKDEMQKYNLSIKK